MSTSSNRPWLPAGWFYPDAATAKGLHTELQRELPPGHLLHGRAVQTFAWRQGATDDVLFQHVDEPLRFTVIHLTWLGRMEIDVQHPSVDFDGTLNGFISQEEKLYGLTPPKDT